MTNVIFKISKGTAILAINPDAKYHIYNDDFNLQLPFKVCIVSPQFLEK